MKFETSSFFKSDVDRKRMPYIDMDYRDQSYDRSLFPYFLVLFLISPVLALISGIASFRKRGAKLICLFFIGAYGYTFILNPGMDSHTMSLNFTEYFSYLAFEDFVQDLLSAFTLSNTGSTMDEPVFIVLTYSIAQFTNSTNVFFLVVSTFYGIFFLTAISIVYNEVEKNWNAVVVILFIFFISWVGLYGINAPRTYIGGWIYFCGAYLFIKTGDYKYILLVMFAPMVHFGYFAMTLPFFAYVVMKDLRYVYVAVLLVSFFATVGLNLFDPILTATELGETKAEIYTGERWENRSGGDSFTGERSFHVQYYRTAGRWAINIMFIGSILFAGYLSGKHHDRLQTGLGSVAILMLSFSNFTTAIPALSGRTFTNFGLFALAYLVRLYSRPDEKLKAFHWVIYLCLPAILLFLLTQYSRIGDYMDFRVLVSPILYPFLGEDPVSIKEFIRGILDL